jgi:two-component system, chemotaxis family, chemotaxis protein CheY
MTANADTGRFKLPTTLDLAAAEGFLDALRQQLHGHARLHLDASAVETLTLPCVQILLAARQSHDQLVIEQPSAGFVSAWSDLGLDSALLGDGDAVEAAALPDAALDLAAAPDLPGAPDLDVVPGLPVAADLPDATPDLADAAPLQPGMEPEPIDAAALPIAQAEEQPMTKRILTIDDSKTIRDMLMLTLADAGFEVLQAIDGQDGLDVLDKEQVDLVITDINMPRMDGYEVIRRMRSNAAYKSMPILVLTTESEIEKKNLARVAGATGWMVKPFDPDRLIATINKVAP